MIIRRTIRYSTITVFVLMCLQSCSSLDLTDDSSVAAGRLTGSQFTFKNFILSVDQAPDSVKQGLVDAFISRADSTTGIPYIDGSEAYFLYLDTTGSTVSVAGDFNDWKPSALPFTHLPGTRLFYQAMKFEPDARLDYKLVLGNDWILDPLNPNTCSGGWGPNSELSMPGYVHPLEILDFEIPLGNMNTISFSDTTLGRTRSITVYTPPGYDSGTEHYRSIYIHDGGQYQDLGSAKKVIDYLIFNELIPPIIAVFVDPTDRDEEYRYDIKFMEMFVNEIVPSIDARYRTRTEAKDRAIAGASLGGLTSLWFTYHHPETFGNCGAYSPAVQIGEISSLYEKSTPLAVKIYLDAGTYEETIYRSSVSFRQHLQNGGWDHKWREWHEGHSWGSWRAHLDESLTYFWSMPENGFDKRD
ncbi:MAG: hypothetical protein K9N35_08385 [Candidatus Marinimicrobia bacterium]|nr:hypothetical protein [Candidatus Neomarinimicrobiota bacterium]